MGNKKLSDLTVNEAAELIYSVMQAVAVGAIIGWTLKLAVNFLFGW